MNDALLRGRFAGLFWTQFLGALNDNFFKNALVILTLYRLMTTDEADDAWVMASEE